MAWEAQLPPPPRHIKLTTPAGPAELGQFFLLGQAEKFNIQLTDGRPPLGPPERTAPGSTPPPRGHPAAQRLTPPKERQQQISQ